MKVLAILVGANSTAACLNAATIAARSLDGPKVEALHVIVDPEKIAVASEEIEFQRLREAQEGTAAARADAIRAAFVAWSNSTNDGTPAVEWKAITGTEEDTVFREAEAADILILVLAREANMDGGDALHAAVFKSQKPVLVVPPNWRGNLKRRFEHVAVGLSDSEATRHAIEGAGPWLRAAKRVTAIRIGVEDDAALGLTRLLSETGLEPVLHLVAPEGADLGAQIVAEAKAIGADLLVTGAYRHAQFVEWLLGGTTRHLLAAADLPLLLAH